jgi:hypothetical protein
LAETGAYPFGRKTYQKMAAYSPTTPADDPYGIPKYVASRTLEPRLGELPARARRGKAVYRNAGDVQRLRLVDSKPTTTGSLLLTYRPA